MQLWWKRVKAAWELLVYGLYPSLDVLAKPNDVPLLQSPLMGAARLAVMKVRKDRYFGRSSSAQKRLEASTWMQHLAKEKHGLNPTEWECNFLIEYAVGEIKERL